MNFFYHILVLISLNWMLTVGYNLVLGKAKILHFGHQGQSLVIAYTMWASFMQFNLPYLVCFALAVSVGVLISLMFGYLSLRLKADAYGVISIAMHLFGLAVVLNWNSVTRGALGIPRIPRLFLPESLPLFALVVFVISVLCILFYRWLDKGPFGRQVSALSEHEWHAQSLGVSRAMIHYKVFLVAGLGPIITGMLWGPYLHLLTTHDYSFPAMIFYVMIVVAGGPGSLKGTLIATVLLIALKDLLRFAPIVPAVRGPLLLMLFGAILFTAVWVRRDTLFPHQREV